jgi:HSP20 family molecular chaperone IbpA
MFMNTTSKVFITGIIALAIGVAVGVGATERETAESHAVGSGTNQLSPAMLPNSSTTAQAWDPFQQIRDMQMQMDQMFSQMNTQFRQEPQFSALPENSGYSLTLNVQEQKNRFEVTAFLPDAKASDVHVKLENNQTLKVNVGNEQTQTSSGQNAATSVAEWGQYEQVIQLPSPVKADQMKVERHNHELVITLPKA